MTFRLRESVLFQFDMQYAQGAKLLMEFILKSGQHASQIRISVE